MHVVTINGPTTWTFDGNVNAPTLSPSVLVQGVETNDEGMYVRDTVCHSFVHAGRIQFLGDCTHELRGQTVDLPDMPASL